MRRIILCLAMLSLVAPSVGAAEPLVETYLHSGQLARGEQVLESALAAAPADDQLRFGLAVLQLVRGVERLGQSLHEYGCLSENNSAPFLRIPVPHNPDPSPITYFDFRRMLDGFRSDLATVELTLAGIKSDEVSLPVRLANIQLDLTGRGNSNERFIDILKKLMGPGFRVDPENPEFLVGFDRGDVAWLRAYCHLLMGLIDLNLAVQSEANFNLWADLQFAKPKHPFTGKPEERWQQQGVDLHVVKITEPARLGHFRQHVLKVCELNRETWAFIRAETDNKFEWLPNPKQTGVLRMPVTDQMIDAWLGMVAEVEGLFDGKKVMPMFVLKIWDTSAKKGMNFKILFDDPPDTINWHRIQREGFRDKYLDDTQPDVDIRAFIRVFQTFQDTLSVGYAVWFN
jgi:hypothetical protein